MLKLFSISLPLALLAAFSVVILGCENSAELAGPGRSTHAFPTNGLSKPVELPFFNEFDDVNPCTGLIHTITVNGMMYIIDNNGTFLVRITRTVTTSSGFVGHGEAVFNNNGQVWIGELTDILTHPSGERILAHFNLVIDLSTGTVNAFNPFLTCLGP